MMAVIDTAEFTVMVTSDEEVACESLAVSRSVYVPGTGNVALDESELVLVKVAVPGPLT
jgi:hypothetical protein